MKRLVLAFPVILLASCDAIPIAPEPAYYPGNSSSSSSSSGAGESCVSTCDGSGSRLRRYVYTSSDGLRVERPARFYDTILDAECVPVRTNHGFLCVPFSGVSTVSTNVFVDPLCKIPGLYLDNQCEAPMYLHVTSSAACGMFATSIVLAVDTSTVMPNAYHQTEAGCVPNTASELTGKAVYAITGEADYDAFASVALGHE